MCVIVICQPCRALETRRTEEAHTAAPPSACMPCVRRDPDLCTHALVQYRVGPSCWRSKSVQSLLRLKIAQPNRYNSLRRLGNQLHCIEPFISVHRRTLSSEHLLSGKGQRHVKGRIKRHFWEIYLVPRRVNYCYFGA